MSSGNTCGVWRGNTTDVGTIGSNGRSEVIAGGGGGRTALTVGNISRGKEELRGRTGGASGASMLAIGRTCGNPEEIGDRTALTTGPISRGDTKEGLGDKIGGKSGANMLAIGGSCGIAEATGRIAGVADGELRGDVGAIAEGLRGSI